MYLIGSIALINVLAVVILARLGRRLFGTAHELRDARAARARADASMPPYGTLPALSTTARDAPRARLTHRSGETSASPQEQDRAAPVAQPMP